MTEPYIERDAGISARRSAGVPLNGSNGGSASGTTTSQQYELLLAKLARAERELEDGDSGGRGSYLEAASAIVFDLLYSLDFKRGGELVPRLAALYGYIGNELLNVGRTGDREQLGHLKDMIETLHGSWSDRGERA